MVTHDCRSIRHIYSYLNIFWTRTRTLAHHAIPCPDHQKNTLPSPPARSRPANLLFFWWSAQPVAASFLYPRKEQPLNDQILQAIDEEIAKLRQVRAILTGTDQAGSTTAQVSADKPRRQLSAKARRAIADAQRRRWAKVKSQKKATSAAGKKEAIAS